MAEENTFLQEATRSWRSLAIHILISVGILGFAFFVTISLSTGKSPQGIRTIKEIIPTVKTEIAERETGGVTFQVDGVVIPFRKVVVASEVSGNIEFLSTNCRIGRYVQKGELLVEVDQKDYLYALEEAQQNLITASCAIDEWVVSLENNLKRLQIAREQFNTQKQEAERCQELHRKGAVSQTELETATLNLLAKKEAVVTLLNENKTLKTQKDRLIASRDSADVAVEKAKLNLKRCTVKAPITGLVVGLDVEQDKFIQRGETLVTIHDTSRLEVQCSLYMKQVEWLWSESQQQKMEAEKAAAENLTASPKDILGNAAGNLAPAAIAPRIGNPVQLEGANAQPGEVSPQTGIDALQTKIKTKQSQDLEAALKQADSVISEVDSAISEQVNSESQMNTEDILEGEVFSETEIEPSPELDAQNAEAGAEANTGTNAALTDSSAAAPAGVPAAQPSNRENGPGTAAGTQTALSPQGTDESENALFESRAEDEKMATLRQFYQFDDTPVKLHYVLDGTVYQWNGTLTYLDGPGLDSRTRMMPCRVEVENPLEVKAFTSEGRELKRSVSPTLMPGMYVTIEIHAKPARPMLNLSEMAVLPGGTVWKVRKNEEGKDVLARADKISTAHFDTKTGRILVYQKRGVLEAGDQVIVSPLASPVEGTYVNVMNSDTPSETAAAQKKAGKAAELSPEANTVSNLDSAADSAPGSDSALDSDSQMETVLPTEKEGVKTASTSLEKPGQEGLR